MCKKFNNKTNMKLDSNMNIIPNNEVDFWRPDAYHLLLTIQNLILTAHGRMPGVPEVFFYKLKSAYDLISDIKHYLYNAPEL